MKQIASNAMKGLLKLTILLFAIGSLSANDAAIAETGANERRSLSAATDAGHAFYVGLTDIVYNPESGTYEITLKVFTDDLELALRQKYDRKVLLDDVSIQSELDDLVFAYVENHFTLSENTKTPLKLTRIGRETEMDVTWIYLESAAVQPLRSMLVSNSMMMEIYDTQSHVVNITQAGSTHSTLLHHKRQSDLIKL